MSQLIFRGFLLPALACIATACQAEEVAPQWIWDSEMRDAPRQVLLGRTIEVDETITAARLAVAGDFCRVKVFLGKRFVAELDDYHQPQSFDVTGFMRRGKNSLTLQCSGARVRP